MQIRSCYSVSRLLFVTLFDKHCLARSHLVIAFLTYSSPTSAFFTPSSATVLHTILYTPYIQPTLVSLSSAFYTHILLSFHLSQSTHLLLHSLLQFSRIYINYTIDSKLTSHCCFPPHFPSNCSNTFFPLILFPFFVLLHVCSSTFNTTFFVYF